MSKAYEVERTEQGLDIAEASKRIVLLEHLLADARDRLASFIGADCECDNTHENNGTTCALCQYTKTLGANQ